MKKWIMGIIVAGGLSAWAGTVGVPTDRIAFPQVAGGSYLVCVWDETAGNWLAGHVPYDRSGAYTFTAPSWNRWYWVGLWDSKAGRYVYGTWVGHIKTE